ncbi:DUF1542 domain-containing protein, partial [Staphylococcus aureus]|uniref:DUF1542 domain-containing protein n=1 Tax=Staphylococcus aureus TaxID=1280 RepID=UPI0021B26838
MKDEGIERLSGDSGRAVVKGNGKKAIGDKGRKEREIMNGTRDGSEEEIEDGINELGRDERDAIDNVRNGSRNGEVERGKNNGMNSIGGVVGEVSD